MKIENNKHVSSQFGMPRYTNLDYIKKVKYTRILFLRVNDSVVVSLTSDNDKRIKEWAKRATNKFSILLSTEVRNPIKTRKYFWDKLKPYQVGNKKEHRYIISDKELIDIITTKDIRLAPFSHGEYINRDYIKHNGQTFVKNEKAEIK